MAVPQAGHLGPHPLDMAGVHRGDSCPRAHPGIGQNRAPRVNNKGMAMALTAPIVQAGLGRRQYVGGVFNGPGLKQHLPMVLAGGGGKGSGHHHQLRPGPGQMAV